MIASFFFLRKTEFGDFFRGFRIVMNQVESRTDDEISRILQPFFRLVLSSYRNEREEKIY